MPIQREQLEAIVKSLDTGTLVKFLQQQGIQVDAQPSSAELMVQAAQDKPESWNEMKVDVPTTQRGPINDPASYMAQQPQAQQTPIGARPQYLDNPPKEDWYTDGPVQ